jgi:hypothetical protein
VNETENTMPGVWSTALLMAALVGAFALASFAIVG